MVVQVAGAKMYLKCSEFRVGSAIFASDAPNAGTRSTTSTAVAVAVSVSVAVGGTFLLDQPQHHHEHVPSHTSKLHTRRRIMHNAVEPTPSVLQMVYKFKFPCKRPLFLIMMM